MSLAAAASNLHHSYSAALNLAYCTSLHTKLSVLSAENPPPGGFSADKTALWLLCLNPVKNPHLPADFSLFLSISQLSVYLFELSVDY